MNYSGILKDYCVFAEELLQSKSSIETLISCGDFNSDGKINVFDTIRAKRELLNKNEQPFNLADINADGAFNILDVQILQDYILLRDISGIPDLVPSETPDNTASNNYRYAVFSGGKDSEMSVVAPSVTLNGVIASNGTIEMGENVNGDNSIAENANISLVYMNDKIIEHYFSNPDKYDEFIVEEGDDINYIIENPILSYDEIKISKKLTLSNACMMSMNNIYINADASNEGDMVLYSKYGDITIDGDNINLVGLVYAPFGTVKLSAKTIQIDGIIIAKNVIIEAEEIINIHTNTAIAEFIGIDTEKMVIPYSEWEYIDKPEDADFPEIVEEQIYNDPLSVDDEWLIDHYGEEVVEKYNDDMKRQLVEALFMAQKQHITNFYDIVHLLKQIAEYGNKDSIKLETELSKDGKSQFFIDIDKYQVRVGRTEEEIESGFIGPLLPDGAGRCVWEYCLFVKHNSSDSIDDKDDDDKDKFELKKYPIKDLPKFMTLLASGTTVIKIKAAEAGVIVDAALTEFAATVTNEINNGLELLVNKTESAILALSQSKLAESLSEIADIDLFDIKQRVATDGIYKEMGPIKIGVSNENGKYKADLYINEDKVDVDSVIEKITERENQILLDKKFTEPICEKGGKPTGEYAKEDSKGRIAQNKAADILADAGFEIEMLPENADKGNGYGKDKKSNPDFVINKSIDYGSVNYNGEKFSGRAFDCYTPEWNEERYISSDSKGKETYINKFTNNACRQIHDKINKQTERIIIYIENMPFEVKDKLKTRILGKAKPTQDLKDLKELIAVYPDGTIEQWY